MDKESILKTACLAAATLLVAACTQDEAINNNALSEGAYPMTFSTAVEGLAVTRATTADGQWTQGDAIAVQVEGSGVKQYAPASGGSSAILQAAAGVDPFYWQASDETKTVSAWYCGDEYKAALPTSWTVQTDQSGDGYRQSDFLYAPATNISFTGRNNTSLTFHHQTAKVVFNILNAEAATDAAQIQSVRLLMDTRASYASPSGTNTVGTWSAPTATTTIAPKDITATGNTNILKSYAALVIPQHVTDQLIAVRLSDGNTYYYTPQNDDGKLEPGQQHTYNITVKYGYLEVVKTSGGQNGVWGNKGEVEVSSR